MFNNFKFKIKNSNFGYYFSNNFFFVCPSKTPTVSTCVFVITKNKDLSFFYFCNSFYYILFSFYNNDVFGFWLFKKIRQSIDQNNIPIFKCWTHTRTFNFEFKKRNHFLEVDVFVLLKISAISSTAAANSLARPRLTSCLLIEQSFVAFQNVS